MITEALLTFLFSPFVMFLDMIDLSSIALNVDFSIMDSFLSVVGTVLYFFPVRYIAPIFGFILALQAFRLLIALLKLLAQLIPLW